MGIVQINGTDTINISGTAGVVAKLGVGIAPTARLTLAAGTATAATAPLKLTSGVNLSAVEAGALEFDGLYLYFTPGLTRQTIMTNVSAQLTAAGTPDGFENRTDSSLAFSDAAPRLFTIAPLAPATAFSYWYQTVKYTKNAAETVTISNTAGLHTIYYVGGTLTDTVIFPGFNVPLVAFIYWNGTKHLTLQDERHGIVMDYVTHEYLHDTIGMRYASGLALTNLLTGTGAADTNAQISLTEGEVFDEDIDCDIYRSATPTLPFYQELGLSTTVPGKFPILYRLGATAENWTTPAAITTFPVTPFDGSAGSRIGYNLNTAGTWSVADPGQNNYVAVWIVATNNQENPIMAVMGQRFDTTLLNAQTNNTWATMTLGNLPVNEMKMMYRLIYKTATGYANAIKAYVADIVDYRNTSNLPSSSYVATQHSSLSGLNAANQHPAASIYTDTTNFNQRLSAADTTVQLALDTLDDANWITALNLDFTLEGSQTLTTDGNYTIGGKTWIKGNSAGDSTAMAVTGGVGLVIIPKQATNISGATFSDPYLRIPLTTLIPLVTPFTPIRITMYVSANNLAADNDHVGGLIMNHTTPTDMNFFGGLKFATARCAMDEVNMAATNQGGTVANAADTVLLLSLEVGMIGGRCEVASKTYSVWPPNPALLVPQYRFVIPSGPPTMAAISNFSFGLAAGRNGSGTALSCTIAKVMVRYIPNY